jgi:TetR/AcrR family transcriptional repressor of nem operon
MPRSRKVEPEEAVNAAMALFWTHGYCSLGTRQIEEETGITRFTLQTTYGGKMKLFLKALDAYLDTFERSALMTSLDGDAEKVAAFFETRGDPKAMPDIACQGCLMLNSMIEFSSGNAEINQRTDRYCAMLRNGFRSALELSKTRGDLPQEFNALAMAEVLLSAALGLNAVIRSSADPRVGETMAASIAVMVRGWASKGSDKRTAV